MKLYELPRDTGAKIYGLEPDGDKDGVVIFGHLDGMYSYCWVMDKDAPYDQTDELVHLNASLELEPYKDGYKPRKDK